MQRLFRRKKLPRQRQRLSRPYAIGSAVWPLTIPMTAYQLNGKRKCASVKRGDTNIDSARMDFDGSSVNEIATYIVSMYLYTAN
uniref:Uncharacterized protein n=1 Tax=Panagrellus redivivus TaxID=6233 RepID=A0A7E4V7Q9_PANRE